MSSQLYAASVPVFAHYLTRLAGLLEKAESYLLASCQDPSAVLEARLAPDMFPFCQQARTAIGFTLRISCPLAGVQVPKLRNDEDSFSGLHEQLAETLQILDALPVASFDHAEERRVVEKAGLADREFDGAEFLFQFGLPNFFFHLAMAYAILRSLGLAVSKTDFDGFHEYPAGFQFPQSQ